MKLLFAPTQNRGTKGKLVGQKAPFKLKEIWAIRVRLQLFRRARDLALFDLGIDSKLRACDLVRLKVRDICHGDRVAARAIVMQQKTSRPVQFEITESPREAIFETHHPFGLGGGAYSAGLLSCRCAKASDPARTSELRPPIRSIGHCGKRCKHWESCRRPSPPG
jgi:hypothetical protein